ncbi:MAG: hypothetical protein NTY03_17930 [Candidatus Bathyarchaeota archaeon]|jgi:hypothetical protein|nr:hypothetical protein [Candidatus Bathyarchaeota archaeon]
MIRCRLEREETQEVKRGLLLRMRELLEERRDLHTAEVVYSLFLRLDSGEKGRPKKVKVDWDIIDYAVNYYI